MSSSTASKPARMTQAERSAQSDSQMFDAAIRLIVDQGPQRATLAEIGTSAGYSRGLAAYRYKTKDVFYSALIEHLHHLWCEELESATAGTSGFDTIIAAVTALQNFVRSNPDHLRAMYKLYYHTIDHHSEITQKLQEIHLNQRKQAVRWIGECADFSGSPLSPDAFAEQYCALIFGGIYQWLVSPEEIDLDRLLEHSKYSLRMITGG
ncbi:TetR/AcrR family transcriptional regulator [Microbulbifer sp. CAU 1566]|uniref:TetR/AcrR family transcriptional regulator n=1 Tax=Microbulbifer sp. CAU 1566 TaxID=2933269 RepID=UPI0020065B82|nr:TetR/AcrR family transcriptional regulator [Microbulbifer sp. CAU 1566]MCK7597534.1 TetR/AcrR family transcriptional regulator [Microbulbifer sp. CAU 1566]